MIFSIQLCALVFIILCKTQSCLARKENGFRHEVIDSLNHRNVLKSLKRMESNTTKITTEQCFFPATKAAPITTIFPSPGATPVEVFTQSQVVTSYIPEVTWCIGPPIALVPTSTISGPPYSNSSTLYSTSIAGTGSCETVYAETATTVCATTLTGLGSKITVTSCDQEITFSSECGFTLETPSPTLRNFTALITPAPAVKRMMTYWLAPWQSLTLGETPSDVDIKVCTILNDDEQECRRYQEVWEVVVVTQTMTTERQIRLTTTVSGPGTLIVESLQAFINDTIVFVDLSTTLLLETEIEIETISKSKKLVTRPDMRVEPTATVFLTKEVK
ncbi:hypothetical protein B0J11DRAFT_71404 [Dendryphion nanum]|uniref:Uncharacterized protein n=1 Tax=Dendryphion nanum TaxID=256645 RepID=A0A9P9DIM1_9PLEO|nr:hypothetical protein B0J11DRAFT_71404 [Dendryphion nanum]